MQLSAPHLHTPHSTLSRTLPVPRPRTGTGLSSFSSSHTCTYHSTQERRYLLPVAVTHQRGSLTRLQRVGPSSEAGGGEDLVVPVAEARVKLLLALLDLTQGLVVGLVELVDHGRDRACGVGA